MASSHFRVLRHQLKERCIREPELAEALGKSETYVSSRLNAKFSWTLDDMYSIMGLVEWPPERMSELFPAGGVLRERTEAEERRLRKRERAAKLAEALADVIEGGAYDDVS